MNVTYPPAWRYWHGVDCGKCGGLGHEVTADGTEVPCVACDNDAVEAAWFELRSDRTADELSTGPDVPWPTLTNGLVPA